MPAKDLQIIENELVGQFLEKWSNNRDLFVECYDKPLRSCQAKVWCYHNGITGGTVWLLQSYRTVVAAVIQTAPGTPRIGFDFLRLVYGYTATSAEHISKFFTDYRAEDRNTWKEVRH